jgi:ferritin-like metal-binding protein YciE
VTLGSLPPLNESNTTRWLVNGCARTYAQLLGDKKGAQLLQTTFTEEADTDKKLTELATSVINVAAAK